ncbi:hypothetical protein KP79_PYT05176 [Mizuhopecten yessoensis]|uniref:Uncharacterized protein n=1 Tax=Mizuhopecten yessoensis TaxID=6573 RepID=A0A210PH24_MIZYE|nr:hypothetical protein KP79_PYT05176 [Mizuhopecten yessoensis]
MSAVLPSATDSIPLLQQSPAHPLQLPNSSDMQRNYAFATLPSYLQYTRRETIKTDVAKDTTAYANIRQKISSTSLTIPYEKGLDTLRALQRSNNTSSAELGSILKLQKRRTDNITYNRTSSKQIINDVLTPGRQSPRTRLGSEGGSSVRSTESKLSKVKVIRARPPGRKDRLESETSSNASRSRPTSYTSWYTDDSLWSDKLVEIKERYADNSDFITSMRRDKGDDKSDNRSDVTSETDLSPRLEKNIYSPHKIKIKHSNKKIPKLKKGRFLPTIPIHDEDQRSGDGRCSSHTGSSKSTKVNINFLSKDNHDKSYIQKRRKVEFNLKPKRTVRLPPIPSKKETKVHKKPKSILKKYDEAFGDLPPSLSPSPSSGETREENVTFSWQDYLPRLRSPVPSARRQATSFFQRQNNKVKCSKEFETVASDIQSDKNDT